MTISPTLGVGSLTVLDRTRLACWGFSVELALLFAGLGSNWSEWLIVAVLVWAWGLPTTTVKRSVSGGAVVVTVPTVHTPVLLSYVPWLGRSETNKTPGGS